MRVVIPKAGVLVVWVPGKARGKGRPRATIAGGGHKGSATGRGGSGHKGSATRPRGARVRLYAAAEDVTAEAWVRACWSMEHKGREPLTGAVGVLVEVVVARPAASGGGGRWADWRTAADLGLARPVGKPDADNVAKLVLDGLNGVAWVDDAQVVDLAIVRTWAADGSGPGVRVSVWGVAGWVDRPR